MDTLNGRWRESFIYILSLAILMMAWWLTRISNNVDDLRRQSDERKSLVIQVEPLREKVNLLEQRAIENREQIIQLKQAFSFYQRGTMP